MAGYKTYVLASVLLCVTGIVDSHLSVYVNVPYYGDGYEPPATTGEEDVHHGIEEQQGSSISINANGVGFNITSIKLDVFNMVKEAIKNKEIQLPVQQGQIGLSEFGTKFNATEMKMEILAMVQEELQPDKLKEYANTPTSTKNELNMDQFKTEIAAMVKQAVEENDRKCTNEIEAMKESIANIRADMAKPPKATEAPENKKNDIAELKSEIFTMLMESIKNGEINLGKPEEQEEESKIPAFNQTEFRAEIIQELKETLKKECTKSGNHTDDAGNATVATIRAEIDQLRQSNQVIERNHKTFTLQFKRLLKWQRKIGTINEKDLKKDIFTGLRASRCEELNHLGATEAGYYLMQSSRTAEPVYKHCNFQVFEGVTTCAELKDRYNVTQPGKYIMKGDSSSNSSELLCDFTAREGVTTCTHLAVGYGMTEPGYYLVNSSFSENAFIYCEFAVREDVHSCHELKTRRHVTRSGYYLLKSSTIGTLNFTYCHFEIFEGISHCQELKALYNMTESGYYYLKQNATSEVVLTYCSLQGVLTCTDLNTKYNISDSGFYLVKPSVWLDNAYMHCEFYVKEVSGCDELKKRKTNPKSGYHLVQTGEDEIPTLMYCHFEIFEGASTCQDIESRQNNTNSGYYYLRPNGTDEAFVRFCAFDEVRKSCEELKDMNILKETIFYMLKSDSAEPLEMYCDLTLRTGVRNCVDLYKEYSMRRTGFYLVKKRAKRGYESMYCDFTIREEINTCKAVKSTITTQESGYYQFKSITKGSILRYCDLRIFTGNSTSDGIVYPTATESGYYFVKFNDTSEVEMLHCIIPGIEGEMRLAGPGTYRAGRVEIFHNGIWGTVRHDYWDLFDAAVVCRYLGFGAASEAPRNSKYGKGSGTMWLDDLGCTGMEDNLGKCSHAGWKIAYTSYTASAVCEL